MQIVSFISQTVDDTFYLIDLNLILVFLVTQSRDLALHVVNFLVRVVLLRLELLAQLHLFLKIIFKLVGHLCSTIPVGLKPSQLLHAFLA